MSVLLAAVVRDPEMNRAMGMLTGLFGLTFVVFALVFFALSIWAYWRIASKAGYNGALSLLLLVPFINIIMLFVFAFSTWPIQREVELLRSGSARPPGTLPPGTLPATL